MNQFAALFILCMFRCHLYRDTLPAQVFLVALSYAFEHAQLPTGSLIVSSCVRHLSHRQRERKITLSAMETMLYGIKC